MSDRQTGCTTRLMLEAIEWKIQNSRTVIFVIHSRTAESYYRALWRHLGAHPSCIKFVTPDYRFEGLTPEQVFVDHYVFEVGYRNSGLDTLLRRKTLRTRTEVGR